MSWENCLSLMVRRSISDRTTPEFIEIALRQWLQQLQVKTLYNEPDSPWENGYCESFNSKLRDELLAREIFYTLKEAQIFICVNAGKR